ncbi:hypothetical protein [Oxalobacter paraformigenes]|uniref:Uncharacterized protein n=1 Tax=Oxalobacter paraformigenes TaxID=556268 RepID=C3X374_9BURK|nr:hypothetical protein [Oxalobacter paraformigenes]EEO27660.1 hypothetical protein OFAG_00813 [Oxalobacter paraformigenes]
MKIICNLPNASTLINGIPFEKNADGKLVSVDDVPENMLPIFLSIEGYAEFPEQTGDDSGGADDGDPDDHDKGGQDEPGPWENEPGETDTETPSGTSDDESGDIEKDDSGETPQTPEGNASGSSRRRKR